MAATLLTVPSPGNADPVGPAHTGAATAAAPLDGTPTVSAPLDGGGRVELVRGDAASPASMRVVPQRTGSYAFGHQAGRVRVQPAARTGPARAAELPTTAPARVAARRAEATYPVSFTVPPLPGAESKLLAVWNRADWAWGTFVNNPADSRHASADLAAGNYFAIAVLPTWDDAPASLLATPFTVTRNGAKVTFSDRTVETRITVDDPSARRAGASVWISVPGGDMAGINILDAPVRVTPFAVPGVSLRLHEALTPTQTASAPRRYDVYHEFADGAPALPVARVATAQLGRAVTTIRAEGGREPTGGALLSYPETGNRMAVPIATDVTVPGDVTEYATPGRAFTRSVDVGESRGTFDLGERTLTAGANPPDTAGAAPVAPRRNEWGTATRDGDTVEIRRHARFDDAAGNLGSDEGVVMSARLTSGGRTLASVADASPAEPLQVDVDAQPATYELAHTLTRQVPWSRLSTEVRSEWVFASQHTRWSQNLPLIEVDLAVTGLDQRNAAGEQPVTVTATAPGGESEAVVTGLEYSTDDGATWQPVADATLRVPASAQFVSLRATATDQLGGSVRRTIVRAFAGPAR